MSYNGCHPGCAAVVVKSKQSLSIMFLMLKIACDTEKVI